MEQESQQWIIHDIEEEEEAVEDSTLKRKQPLLPHSNEVSSSPYENGNGVCSEVTDPDGSSVLKEEEFEEIGSAGEYRNHVNGDNKVDYEDVVFGLVEEFVEAVTNGEAITESQNKNSVYFDKQQGMWKCHHCTWTKGLDSPRTVPVWNFKEYPDLLMNIKTMIQHGPCFFCGSKDYEVNGHVGVQSGDAASSVHPTNPAEREFDAQVEHSVIQNNLCTEINNQTMKTVDEKVHSSLESAPLLKSSNTQASAAMSSHEETSATEGSNLIEEIDEQLQDYDVETVLEKQETHDLICPNCHSCITKRVILKKRKRTIHKPETKAKRDKPDTAVISNLVGSSAHEANQGDHANETSDIVIQEPPTADNNHPDTKPEVFRCLSCFSFFIPSGNCFKLFGNFGGARKQEPSENPSSMPASNPQNPSSIPASNLQNPSSVPASNLQNPSSVPASNVQNSSSMPASNLQNPSNPGTNANWLISLFTSKKGGKAFKPGHPEGPLGDSAVVSAKEPLLSRNLRSNEKEKKNASVDIIKTSKVEVISSTSSDGVVSKYEKVQVATTQTLVNAGETESLVPTILEKSQKDVDNKPETVKDSYSPLRQGAPSPTQSFAGAVLASDIASSNKQSSAIDAIFPSKLDLTQIEKVPKDIIKDINPSVTKENEGGDVIVVVERETFESTTSQTADNVPVEGTLTTESRTLIGEQPRDAIGEPRDWEILKSIVYGGLIESITSLGVVSSAVSSGATPLNIIALGFANIIGGLFILGNNLKDLKNDGVEDRYQEQLGCRSNFLLHAAVAVLSFIIFGSVPLVVYALLINKNYYDKVKLEIVAAVSIVCIILLAIGKVYTGRPPKSYFKTVLYYVTLVIAVSGLSYIAGNLIKDLLEKLNKHSGTESGFAINMPLSDTSMKPAWTSY